MIIVLLVALIVIIVVILIVFLPFGSAGLRIGSHRSRAWPSTLERGHATCCLLEHILKSHWVNLATDLVKKRAQLLRIHILHVLHVGQHLGLVGQHLRRHPPNQGMLVHVVSHLVMMIVTTPVVVMLPVLIVVVLAISMVTPSPLIIIIVSVPVVVTVSVVMVSAPITLVVLRVVAALARLIVAVVASTPISVVVLSGAVRVSLLVLVVMLAVIWTASIPRRVTSSRLLAHICTTRRLKSRLRGC